MRFVLRIIVAVLALTLFATPVAVGADRNGGGHGRPSVVPVGRVAGNSGGRLLGDWFVRNLSLPADKSPFAGAADLCLDIGRRGKVLSPAGGVIKDPDTRLIEMSCTVRAGRPVILVMTSVDCSSAEPGDFGADTAAEQRACAIRNINSIVIRSINVRIDDSRPVDIHQPRFFEVTRQRRVVFPENPVFMADPGPATFVAAAWIAEIRGMKRGKHTMHAVTTYEFGGEPVTFPFIVHFKVGGGGHGHGHGHGGA